MAKVNANYEVVYIMDPALGEEAIAAINDLNEGHYVLMTFTAAPELPAELDRVLKITEGVMRSMIICKDE